DAKDATGIEARMRAQFDKFRGGVGAKLLQAFQGSGFDNFADGAADGVANTGVDTQIGVAADQFVDALAQAADDSGRPTVRPDLIGIGLLDGEHLCQRGEAVRDLRIAQAFGPRRLAHGTLDAVACAAPGLPSARRPCPQVGVRRRLVSAPQTQPKTDRSYWCRPVWAG